MIQTEARPWRLLLLFGAASLLATAAGAWVVAQAGTPAAVWGRNLAAWGVGALAAAALAAGTRPSLRAPVLALAVLGIAATLGAPGLSGVHRWLTIGPIRLNAAELLLPLGVTAWSLWGARTTVEIGAPAVLAALLALQPDASQAAALAAAVAAALAVSRTPPARSALVLAAPLAGAVVAALRPDPLQPVPEVEGVIALALQASAVAAAAAVAGLAGLVLAPLVTARERATAPAAGALTTLLGVAALAPAVGAFPVPYVGVGVSPILGGWLAVGLLAAAVRRDGLSRRPGPP